MRLSKEVGPGVGNLLTIELRLCPYPFKQDCWFWFIENMGGKIDFVNISRNLTF